MQNDHFSPDSVIIRRPQINLKDGHLYFLISTRPLKKLSEFEVKIWNALEQESKFGELKNIYGNETQSVIAKFVQINVCELIKDGSSIVRKKVLVIEPHSDDAALSVGGTMLLQKDTHEFTIATLASISNFTSYYAMQRDFFDINTITALRYEEGMLVARMLNGKYLTIGLMDSALRYYPKDWHLPWFQANHIGVYSRTMRSYLEEDLKKWTQAIHNLLSHSDAEEVWIPLGIGPHSDHQMTRDACLKALIEDSHLLNKIVVKFYLEVPYAAQKPHYLKYLVKSLQEEGIELEEEMVLIDSVFEQKMHLISVYGSQFKVDALRQDIESSAHIASNNKHLAELFWTINKLPPTLEYSLLSPHYIASQELLKQIQFWKNPSHKCDTIFILLLVPTGQWAEDARILSSQFPSANFEVYYAPAAAAEVEALSSPRFRIHPVASGTQAWIKLAFKILWKNPGKTLFITGERRYHAAKMLAILWPLSDTIVLKTMEPFILALKPVQEYVTP